MYLSKSIRKLIPLVMCFGTAQAMLKAEPDAATSEAKTYASLEDLTHSIIEKIKKNPNLLFIKPCPRKNPLVYDLCTKAGRAPLLNNLIKSKALNKDAEVGLLHEKYPLIILAIGSKAQDNMKVLLAAEVDLNITSTNPNAVLSKCTPLSLAIENEDPVAVEMVLQSCAAQQKVTQFTGLMSKGLVNASCDTVRLPLMQAVDRICISNKRDVLLNIIKILLQYRADPNRHDAYGARLGNSRGTYTVDTPYELAEARRYEDIMDLFDLSTSKERNVH